MNPSRSTSATPSSLGWLAMALAAVVSTGIAARSWVTVRLHRDRHIEVTGSAKRRIVSDLIEWRATVTTENLDRTAAYRQLREHVERTLAYLKKQGIAEAELRVQAVETDEIVDTEYIGKGDDRIERKIKKGFRTTQTIEINSKDVDKIERVSREVTQVMESGVRIDSGQPGYYYTGLGALKIEMLAEAAKDCRQRAERMLTSTGGANLGKLRRADMGVINVNPANSTEVSNEGNNDTGSLDKDILTVVHCSFDLES
ncbi:MAG: SIMPL domain-containing protein [Myxococcales bacterium]|nr:SIMPL domain-containing protein [Myxococcales bacterium]